MSQDLYELVNLLSEPEKGEEPNSEEEITDFFRSSANASPCDIEPLSRYLEEDETQSTTQSKDETNKNVSFKVEKVDVDPLSISSFEFPSEEPEWGSTDDHLTDLDEKDVSVHPAQEFQKQDSEMQKPVAPPRKKATSSPKASLDLTPLTPVDVIIQEKEEACGKEQREEEKETASPTETADEEDGEGEETLAALPVEVGERRPTCLRCRRPQKVCLCPFLPTQPLEVSTCLHVVQHPAEESRVLRTVPLLAACLPQGKCNVIVGRRFNEEKHPELAAVCQDSRTLILYPGPNSQNLEELVQYQELGTVKHNVIIIDGTWSQAKNMFLKNSLFHLPKQVQLNRTLSSQYVIRTQPSNICLSTLECAAVALSILEQNDNIQEVLLRPLKALCSFQLQHGAQIHHSKEHLLKNGMYDKPMPKNKRKIKRMEKLVTDHNICPR
ncbi:tRNA-uridine aminocarboxypropyltransferase 2 isoform X2 [Micropterus salmoides]|uniref:tRNA-uridine aminocarboxypropyltransferase 2 isoform X2 n=1 Tax=Micropterus salmoides TaxID=27706 RepID=UPI0018EC4642|nr:tRNA-uridine aminocarboxypropyltransferase 2 isoform X2 [Micropterus salmoides]